MSRASFSPAFAASIGCSSWVINTSNLQLEPDLHDDISIYPRCRPGRYDNRIIASG